MISLADAYTASMANAFGPLFPPKAVERALVQKLIEAHESGDAVAIERAERAVAEAGIWRPLAKDKVFIPGELVVKV